MTLDNLLNYRRAVRRYSKTNLVDTEKVKKCIELAQLAPTSSNLQLWEAYHITDPKVLKEIGHACLDQWSATTAQEIVVFVTRQDLYKKRAKQVFDNNVADIKKNAPKEKIESRIKKVDQYYNKLVPLLYSKFFWIRGCLRVMFSRIMGIFRATVRDVSESDMNTVVHKSCALVAQTFMLAMAEEKYDTCPLEGFDAWKIKKLLNLPRWAKVSIVITCGIREEWGIHTPRFRIPLEEQYKRI